MICCVIQSSRYTIYLPGLEGNFDVHQVIQYSVLVKNTMHLHSVDWYPKRNVQTQVQSTVAKTRVARSCVLRSRVAWLLASLA